MTSGGHYHDMVELQRLESGEKLMLQPDGRGGRFTTDEIRFRPH